MLTCISSLQLSGNSGYLWEFEKRPVKAKIKLEHKDVFANEMVMLEIDGLVDEEGVRTREFDRIIVCPDKGRIDSKLLKSGEQWEMDPKCGVFRVGKGPHGSEASLQVDFH
ncbi:MAG: hypothetical protein JRJ40_11035 [Deltaproteobacteria bacterium]|nr:hypothetical protein [Deltaproteobacteria bacterium]